MMTHEYGVLCSDFTAGDRVGIHPRCDLWMAGDRFGTVTGDDGYYVLVQMDNSNKVVAFHATYLRKVR